MQRDDALGDRQAEPGAALLARDRVVGLLELLEDLGLIRGRDAGTGVFAIPLVRQRNSALRAAGSPASVSAAGASTPDVKGSATAL